MKPFYNYSFYLVIDPEFCLYRNVYSLLEAALTAGVSMVQLRYKTDNAKEFFKMACKVKELTQKSSIPLIINDRVDIALACKADGVHLGQKDLPVLQAREILGQKAIIGLSASTLEHVRLAPSLPIDYIGLGPIFATSTKLDADESMGLKSLSEASKLSKLPIVAIGGINQNNALQVIAAGAAGIAVVSAICSAQDPAMAAHSLSDAIKKGKLINETK